MTRDGTSETAMRLRALGAEIVVGDATREEDCARACRGADAVVAAFGARRMSRAGDAGEKWTMERWRWMRRIRARLIIWACDGW